MNMARGKPWAEPKSSYNPTPLCWQRLNIETSQSVRREDCTSVCVCVCVFCVLCVCGLLRMYLCVFCVCAHFFFVCVRVCV